MNGYGYALIGLTAIVAALVAVLAFALLRFMAAARDTRRHMREGGDGNGAAVGGAAGRAVASSRRRSRR